MAKGSKKAGLILAIIMMVISAALATALALFMTGALKTDTVKLVFAVKDETKVYDGTPLKASEYTLIEGSLPSDVTVEVDFVGEQTNAGTSASDMTVKILDSSNYNVSNKYSIRVEKGSLTVTKRAVDIVLPTQQVEYNGSTVEFTNYRIAEGSTTSLVSGHRVYGSSQDGLLHVGDQLPSDLMPLIYDVAGNDVTNNYEISFAMGKIEIIPRELVVRPVSYSKVYDGLPITVKDVEYVAGSLVNGHYVTYSINNDIAARCTLTNAGKIDTQVTDFRIYQRVNGEAVDVTSNYNVDKTETGVLEITPRQLVIKPTSHTKTYDGMAVDVNVEYLVGTLADGQYIEYTLTDGNDTLGSIKDAGSYTIGLSDVHVMQYVADGSSVDVTSNYSVTATITGDIKINPRPLTVNAKNGTWQYDGNAHSLKADTKPLSTSGLADGDSVSSVTYDGEITGVGEADNVITSVTLSCPNTNYSINAVNGTLTIIPCEIIIRTETKEKYYDTTSLKADTITVEKVADGTSGLPVATHTVVIADTGSSFPEITNAGTVQNRVPLTIKDGENNVASNYSITFEWGNLTVKKMPVIVTLSTDCEATFDGSSKSPSLEESVTLSSVSTECEQTLSRIFNKGERLELFTYVRNMVDAGTYSYSVIFKDNADTLNYSLEVRNTGYFTINPMPITVTLKKYTNIAYTTRPYSLDLSDAIESIKDSNQGDVTIIGKDEFTAVYDGDLTSVGTHYYNVKIKDRSNPDNYEITATDGEVVITAASITITLKSYTDGDAFYYTGNAIEPDMEDAIVSISSDLLKKSDFVLDVTAPIVTAGEGYTYKVKIKDAEIAQNVTFSSPEGNITVKKAEALIVFNDITTVYSGEEYVLDPLTAIASIDGGTAPLTLSDVTLVYQNANQHKNASTTPYYYSMTVSDTLAANYNVKIQNAQNPGQTTTWDSKLKKWENPNVGTKIASVTITKFVLIVTSDSLTFTYDGTPHTAPGFSYISLANSKHTVSLSGVPLQVTNVTYDTYGNVDKVENVQDYQIKEGGTNVTSNYEITKVSGYIIVNPREVTITTATKSFIYDGTAQTAGTASDVTADNLVTQHSLTIATTRLPSVQNVSDGYVSNKLEVKIEDSYASGDKDVTKNYIIKYSYGTINVVKRSVDITTTSQTKSYDGTVLSGGTPTASGLADNHAVAVHPSAVVPSITDAGTIRNEYTCIIKDSNGTGRDVTANYDITYHYGMLEVKKLTVTVNRSTLTSGSALTYNGNVQNPAIGTLITITAEAGASISSDLLPKAYDFDIVFLNSALTTAIIQNAGNYTYEISPKAYLDLTNFTLKYSGEPSIEVKPRAVEVELATFGTLTYNGKNQTPDIETVIKALTQDGGAGALTKADFVAIFSGTDSVVKNAGGYTCEVALSGDIVASNYAITYKDSANSRQITVNKKTITIVAQNVNLTYNGQVQTINPEKAITVQPAEVLEYLSISEFKITVTGGDASIKDANTTTGYAFTVTFENSNFTVNGSSKLSASAYVEKLTVNVTHNMSDFVYDGMVHTLKAADILTLDTDVITPSDLKINCSLEIKNAKSYTYTVAFANSELEKNITLNNINGNFKITPYVVGGTLKDYEKVYDGTVFTLNVSDALSLEADKALLKGSFTITSSPAEIKNAGDYTYTVKYSINGDEIDDNFDMTALTAAVGNVTIKKLAVSATLYNFDSFVYNGQVRQINKAFAITLDTSLLTEADFNITAYTAEGDNVELKNANEYLYRITYNGSEAQNFDFTAAYAARGRVTISPLPVTVTLEDFGKTFDNSALNVTKDNMAFSTNLLTKDDFTLNNPHYAQVNAGKYSYTASYTNSTVPESNYVITYQGGEIVISPLDVTITLANFPNGGSSFVYDGSTNYRSGAHWSNAISVNAPGINNTGLFTIDAPAEMINAGTYTYRVTGYTGVNAGNYNFVNLNSAVGTVTVSPKDVYLKFEDGQTQEYNGRPYTINLNSQSVFDLVNSLDGDVTVSDYNSLINGFKVADGTPDMINVGTYTYRVVYTGDNASNYNFVNINSARGTVEITAKQVTVTLSDFTRTYDGQAFIVPVDTAVSTDDGGLLGGSFRLAAGTPEMRNVKRTSSDVTYYEYSVIYVGNDKSNFNFIYQGQTSGTTGRVTIQPFGVSVHLADFTRVYDGYEFNVPLASALTVNNTLMSGGWTVYDGNGDIIYGDNVMKFAGTYQYSVKYSGADVGNFDFTQVDSARGTVYIRPVSVTVTLPDIEKYYDGVTVTESSISTGYIKISSDLLDRGKIVIGGATNSFEFVDAGSYSYVDKISLSMTEKEKGSFHITYEGGNITIKAVNITVTLPSVTKTYDGKGVTINKEQVYSNSEFFELSKLTININGGDDHTKADYVDAGEYSYINKVSYGTEDDGGKKNVIIEYLGGTIKINPLSVKITLKNYNQTYNGERLNVTAQDAITTSSGLVTYEMFNIVGLPGELKNAGDYSYNVTYIYDDVPETNFSFSYDGGSIVIKPIDLTVNLLTLVRTYNGNYFVKSYDKSSKEYTFDDSFYTVSPALTSIPFADREKLTVDYLDLSSDSTGKKIPPMFPGDYYFAAKFEGEGVQQNYNFNVVGEGKLTISKYRLTVTLKDTNDVTYSGDEITIRATDVVNLPSDIPEDIDGQKIVLIKHFDIVTNKTVLNAGSYTYTTVLNNDDDGYALNNVELTVVNEGHITVLKKSVKVNLATDKTGAYTGLPQYVTGNFATFEGVASGASATPVTQDDFRVKYDATMVDAGKYKYTAELINTSLSNNYDFVIGEGEYEITKAYVYVMVRDFTFTYTGNPVSVDIGAAISTLNTYLDSASHNTCPTPLSKGDLMIVYDNPENLTNEGSTTYTVEFASAAVARNYQFTEDSDKQGSITINAAGGASYSVASATKGVRVDLSDSIINLEVPANPTKDCWFTEAESGEYVNF